MNKHNKTERVKTREQTGGCRGGGEKQAREIKRYKLPVAEQVSHWQEMYIVGNTINKYTISLYGNRW